MQCNTNYTGSTENFKFINLNVIKTYAKKYKNVILGLSDHTPMGIKVGHETVLGAVAMGIKVVEKHFTDNTGDLAWKEMIEKVASKKNQYLLQVELLQ